MIIPFTFVSVKACHWNSATCGHCTKIYWKKWWSIRWVQICKLFNKKMADML